MVDMSASDEELAANSNQFIGWYEGYHARDEEIERLTLENWQLKGVLGYPVPGDIPPSTEFKCGMCDARRIERENLKD